MVLNQADLRPVRRHCFLRILQGRLAPGFKNLFVMLIVDRTTAVVFLVHLTHLVRNILKPAKVHEDDFFGRENSVILLEMMERSQGLINRLD